MGLGERGLSHRWSNLRPAAEVLLDEMQANVDMGINNDVSRFSPAQPIKIPDDAIFKAKYTDCCPSGRLTSSLKWTGVFQILLGRILQTPDASVAIMLHDKKGKNNLSISRDKVDGELWFCAAKNHSMCWLVKLVFFADPGGDLCVKVALPLDIRSTRQLFLPYYEELFGRKGVFKAVTSHRLSWIGIHCGLDGKNAFYAKVALRGTVLFNLAHHEARKPREKPDAAPVADAALDDAAAPAAPPAGAADDPGGPGGASDIRVDEEGNIEYDEDEMIEAIASELNREGERDEMAAEFGEWVAGDVKETSEDIWLLEPTPPSPQSPPTGRCDVQMAPAHHGPMGPIDSTILSFLEA